MKTIKIICLFTFFIVALASCDKNEDGCYDLNDLGHQEQTTLDPSQTDTENDKDPQN